MEALWTEYFKDKRGEVKKWIEKVEKDKQGKIRRTVKWVTRNKKKGCNIDIEGVLDLMEHPEKFQSEMEDMIKSIYDPDEKGVESASKVTRRLRRCGLGVCKWLKGFQAGISTAVQVIPEGFGCLGWGVMLLAIEASLNRFAFFHSFHHFPVSFPSPLPGAS